MKRVMALVFCFMLTGMAWAQAQQGAPRTAAKSTKKRAAARTDTGVTAQLNELKQALDSQQQQIRQLSEQLQGRDQQIQTLQQRLDQSQSAATAAASKADAAASQASQQQDAVTALKTDVADLKTNTTNSALTLQETQKTIQELGSPLAIHYKGITLTPVGFFAAETVWRQHGLGSDINTPLNTVPMPGAAQDRISEFFGTGRQSRIAMLFEGKTSLAKVTGYYESDFLSAGVTSNNNQSNSYTLRQRQIWGQAALDNGLSFTGGQMWSLVTETRVGMNNRTEATPLTIDPQYTVGFSWSRQYGFRVVKNFHNKFWLGASVENAQALFAASGQSQNFVLGSAGTSGGLYNPSATYTFNPSPDFVFKLAAEPGLGHFEIFGVVRHLRDRVYPNATATPASGAGAFNYSTTVGGGGANVRVPLFKKHMDVGLHFLGGEGMGRYGTSSLPDVTVNANGTLSPLTSYQGLGTIEIHGSKFDIYLNGGSEFVTRHVSFTSRGVPVGYGFQALNNTGCYTETVPGTPVGGQFPTSSSGFLPGGLANCAANTRNVIEGTVGFWYRFYRGTKGTVQWGPQYSYLVRNTWSGTTGPNRLGQPSGIENMFFTSFRYILP
jgi:hypothetical protein